MSRTLITMSCILATISSNLRCNGGNLASQANFATQHRPQKHVLHAKQMSIATFIKQELIANIRSGEIGPNRLTLDALSKRFGVSVRPVRAAVHELIEEKYLEKGDDGRLAVRVDALGEA